MVEVFWYSRSTQAYNIYGGLEFVNEGCSPVWFPSAGLFTDRGVLVSGYTDEGFGGFEQLSMLEKFSESRKTIERLHPGHGKELERPLFVGWGRIPWNEGSWIRSYGVGQGRSGPPVPGRKAPDQSATYSGYTTLTEPDGPIYFAGCHVSHIVAWEEGGGAERPKGGEVDQREGEGGADGVGWGRLFCVATVVTVGCRWVRGLLVVSASGAGGA